MGKRICSIEGCGSVVHSRSWCSKHYSRWWKAGSTDSPPPYEVPICSVDECDRASHARGLCGMHYTRLVRTGTVESDLYTRGAPCLVQGCETPSLVRGWCQKHYQRWKRTGDPAHESLWVPTPRSAVVGVRRAHKRVQYARGLPSEYQCVDCGQGAHHWSYDNADPNELASDKGPYSLDVWHYQPRCRTCHKRFDIAFAKAARVA